MKIAVDPWVLANRFSNHGTHVYARNLVTQFQKLAAARAGVEFCLFAPPGPAEPNVAQPGPGFEIVMAPGLKHDRLWRVAGANLAAARAGADLLFSPTSNTLAMGRVPVVVTIHDATPMVTPSHSSRVNFMLRTLLRAAARSSRAIITVSEFSKNDLVRVCGVPPEKISVVYNGYDRNVFNAAPAVPEELRALRDRLGIRRPYVFHHSVIQPRKNLVRLIQAYRLLLERNSSLDIDLVLAGPLGWDYESVLAAARSHPQRRGQVLLPGALPDAELALLIKGASLVVIPSLYEGFCLPMIEAMACGAAVIASATSCLPEVSGNALLYFDPTAIEEIAQQMQSVALDGALAQQLKQRGLERARVFGWEKCAEETLQVLHRAATRRTLEAWPAMNHTAATTVPGRGLHGWMEWLIAIAAVALVVASYANFLLLALVAAVVALVLASVRFRPLLYAVVFFLPVAPFLSWSVPIKDLGTLLRVCLFAGAVVSRVRNRESIRSWLFSGKINWAMLGYAAVAFLSGVALNAPTGPAARELMRLASYVCFYYVISDWVRTDKEFAGVLKALMISTLFVVGFGFYQIVVGDYSALYDALYPVQEELLKNPPWAGRITSFLSHYNGLAGYLNLVIPFCIGFALRARETFLRRLSWVCFALSSIALLLTQSRGGLIAYVVILLLSAYFLAPTRRSRIRWIGSVALMSAIGAVLAGLAYERLAGVDEATEITRLAIWAGAASVFGGAPWMGIGYGNLRQALGGVIGMPEGAVLDAHNLYLELLAETGIAGFAAFAVLVVMVLWLALRAYRQGKGEMESVIGFAAFAGTVGVLVHGSVDYMFHTTPQFAALFFLVLGLLNAVGLRQSVKAQG